MKVWPTILFAFVSLTIPLYLIGQSISFLIFLVSGEASGSACWDQDSAVLGFEPVSLRLMTLLGSPLVLMPPTLLLSAVVGFVLWRSKKLASSTCFSILGVSAAIGTAAFGVTFFVSDGYYQRLALACGWI